MSAGVRICLLGFGEVGQILAADLIAHGITSLVAWDLKFADPASAPRRACDSMPVRRARDAGDGALNADIIISAVTAAQDVEAAQSVAPHIDTKAFFLDLNSVSPGVKKQVAGIIEAAGAAYVEAAIMSPISPQRIAAPMLFGGPHAATFLPVAKRLGFSGAQVFSDELGRASAAKMCRSIVVKGMEALLAESLLTARHYGVEGAVLDSLQGLLRSDSPPATARYMISRSLIHGQRRAEEMREVAKTVADAGLDPWMSSASARRQDWAAEYREAASQEDLDSMLDAIRAADGKG
jgi:3-hydroxyisobutyrate dehydrogenase-like beta-hydroxyacid dehydrogenase